MFVRGGYAYPGDDLDRAGYEGYYWSFVGLGSGDAYGMRFNPYGVRPSVNDGRYVGYSVRCVALGG